MNSGAGASAGAFGHERHLGDKTLAKLHGWGSTKPDTRFQMAPVVDEPNSADSWAMSNPPILAMAPVLASLEMFDEVGIDTLRAKSVRLTAYLESLLDIVSVGRPLRVITPRDPERRGAQLSVQFDDIDVSALTHRLRSEFGIIADARMPDVIRFAPIPFYSSFHDCWRVADALAHLVAKA